MTTVGVFAAILTITAMLPSMAAAQGNLVDDLLKGLLGGGNGAAPAGDAPAPQAGTPPNYVPPLHGTGAHGQGTTGVVDLAPSNTAPLGSDPATGDEDIIIGDAVGSQDAAGNYNGRVQLLHINLLGLLNVPVLSNTTVEGESKKGPLDPIQTGVLDTICTALTQPAGCVTVLKMDSETTATGSQNDFQVAGVNLPGIANVGAAESSGSISETSTCQTATGSSSTANANVLGAITAGVMNASSTSEACNTGTTSQTNDSDVATLQDIALTDLLQPGCGTSGNPGTPATPNTQLVPAFPLVGLVCAADDSSSSGGSQTSAPYGVREALSAFALGLPLAPLLPLKAVIAGPESHAVAPAAVDPPDTPGGPGPNGNGGGDNGNGNGDGGPGGDGDDGPGGPATGTGQPGDGQLAFTGSNLVLLALLGGVLVLGGVAIATASGRRRSLTS
jgi:hypothetical protein